MRKLLTLPWLWMLTATILYFGSRLFSLTSLPVFADEAIYIRWAQLIRHDLAYVFFSLNDGKPPLFIWSLLPAVEVFPDPLWPARATSAIFGFVQLLLLDRILVLLKAPRASRLASAVVVILAPFWFFSHRMAMMDGLLTAALTLSLFGLLWLHQILSKKKPRIYPAALATLVAGTGFGLALLTKTPALFFAPTFVLVAYGLRTPLFSLQKADLVRRTVFFGAAGVLGLSLFGLLRIQPHFGSLFSRSSDFTFSLQEILAGQWHTSLDNVWRMLRWLSASLRPEFLSLTFLSLLFSQKRRLHWVLFLSMLAFAAPLLLLGKTLHPRYFLPLSLFITLSGSLYFGELWQWVHKSKELLVKTTFWLLVFLFFIGSLRFMFFAFFTPDQIPFVREDRSQYLTEWSSGHGLAQIRDRLLEKARQGERVTVVTEGSFGTLPDGLLMSFDNRPEIAFLRIEGLAQYPVKFLPEWVWEQARSQTVWLVVNENRNELPPETLAKLELIGRYARPYGAADLQLYAVIRPPKE